MGGDEESNVETQNGSAAAESSSSDAINYAIKDLSEGSLASLVSSQPMSSSSELQHNIASLIPLQHMWLP